MAVLVCNFQDVEEQGNITCDNAKDMDENISAYKTKLDDKLSGWTGTAKEEFNASNEYLIQNAQKVAAVNDSLGEFILIAKDAIYELEEELATMNI